MPVISGMGGTFETNPCVNQNGLFTPSAAPAGIHKVKYTFTAPNGCVSSDSTDVTVLSIPNASINQPNGMCANGVAVQLVPTFTSGGTFQNEVFVNATGLFDPKNAGAGQHKVAYQVTDNNGCTETISVTINQPATECRISKTPTCHQWAGHNVPTKYRHAKHAPTKPLATK